MKIAFKTLGCRVNLYETDALASRFKAAGYEIVDADEDTDIFVVNTCTVTNQSDQKCRQALHQIRRQHPESLIVATGCMVNHRKNELLENKTVDYAIDNERKYALFNIIDKHFKGEQVDPEGLDVDLFGYQPAFDTFHTRSLIKIHDGCNNFCSYCLIPMVRGRATSRSDKDIYDNIRSVVDHGFKEIVLTGVNMGRYQYQDVNFEGLVENILNIDGDFRLRISSIEPDNFSDRFLRLFENEKLAPHMHICLQSGAENTLKAMRRHYTAAEFKNMCERIKTTIPDFNITTDLIVGFPGETEEDFLESAEMCREVGFSHIHTFKYSVRNGTKAATMPNQIPEKIKTERSAVIRNISSENKKRYFEQMIGKQQKMLIERISSDGIAQGYGENYIPMRLKGKHLEKNTFVDVIVDGIIGKGDKAEVRVIQADTF
ncbi:MAG: tRNA (N(6)-L-threonylcarbamoyladenosine(37)-C(2))-methylthiotransferase MtaB [Lentimicrobiaceae bacterium]|nr:tRNA (N(6)-L-threonylcarbamoyladenosine(37)-C(2))-methylthiotransferase MtaB [Lentimicrobiaceae bacterium]